MHRLERQTVASMAELDTLLSVSEQPVYIQGAFEHWPAVKAGKHSGQALVDYLNRFDQGQPVTAYQYQSGGDGRIFYNEDVSGFNFEPRQMSFQDFASQLLNYSDGSDGGLYLGSTLLDKWFSGFTQANPIDVSTPWQHITPLVSLWMGNPSRVAAHFDFPDNLAVCVSGRRQVTLFPPEQLENLYIGPLDFNPGGQPISMVDLKHPDFTRFPKFRTALEHAVTTELEPGDAIFIPSMWWHAIDGKEQVNTLVNYWWRNTPSYLGAPINVLLHAIMSLKELPKRQREGWQNLLNHYVFEHEQQDSEHLPAGRLGPHTRIDAEGAQRLRSMLLNKFGR
ncbi:cupin-like domain-containing protein [Lacimicrobium sp. SS2-24]|uniref:cupin-like domain-containing protein n=1 Tax=Lacimicrobium sp. SS2-24 TaxID=2005569 RepID=UPI000B4B4E85|nr:cupin-like domain-containing protein [Lacimicrobium sp. SS2-24]